MFDAFDKDHSGALDFDEFLISLRVCILTFPFLSFICMFDKALRVHNVEALIKPLTTVT